MIDGRLSELEYRCGHRVFFGAIELELGHNAFASEHTNNTH